MKIIETVTYVHRAYKNPQKQNAAISISATNCTSIALRAKTMRLFRRVTKANLELVSGSSPCWKSLSYRGNMKHAIRARQSIPFARAHLSRVMVSRFRLLSRYLTVAIDSVQPKKSIGEVNADCWAWVHLNALSKEQQTKRDVKSILTYCEHPNPVTIALTDPCSFEKHWWLESKGVRAIIQELHTSDSVFLHCCDLLERETQSIDHKNHFGRIDSMLFVEFQGNYKQHK